MSGNSIKEIFSFWTNLSRFTERLDKKIFESSIENIPKIEILSKTGMETEKN